MNILITAATEFELDPFISENKVYDVLITGIGIPATIFHLTKRLCQKKYDLVIQAGIAGTFSEGIKKGTVVLVNKDSFGDIGIEEKKNFNTLFDAGFINKNEFPFTDGWLVNTHEYLSQSSLTLATGITVNKITDDAGKVNQMFNKFQPGIESMEGAALHYVCLLQNAGFLQLRSISNIVGERDKSKWAMKEAIANLNVELKSLLKNFM